MTKTISITLDQDIIKYIDELAEVNARTRSGMISYILKLEMARDAALDEEAKEYEKESETII